MKHDGTQGSCPWTPGEWGECVNMIQTRDIQCSTGPEEQCALSTRPNTTQSCVPGPSPSPPGPSPSPSGSAGGGHTGVIIGVIAAAVVVLAVGTGGVLYKRRNQRGPSLVQHGDQFQDTVC